MAALGCWAPSPGAALHGFKVDSVEDLPEVPARMVRMTYARNGAELVWLDRDDDNKTFAIAFKTVPSDDTGVAHILEHSVLCGSERFPVKEPFVELLKSSLQTFLNAMTGDDVTIYPVSSRNDRDFLNLAEVYLDAVFHPLSMKRDSAFCQEGWHYELDGGRLVRNGIVYSEMKGVFADPDSVAHRELSRMLFPDTPYGRESGGDPAHIPELTYEGYRAFYRRFYHPSNAYVFLDGRVDIERTLELLDSFLCEYGPAEGGHAAVPVQSPVVRSAKVEYESDETVRRTILLDGWVYSRFDDLERQYAYDILSDAIAGANDAPLAKALLDAGLCEDVEMGWEGSLQQVATICIRNTDPDKAAECRRVVRGTIERLCREGLDRRRLSALIDRLEFRERERDSGSRPCGLMYMHAALDSWIHGGDPAMHMRLSHVFAALRDGLDKGLFEKYLREIFLECPHRAELDMVPSATLAARRRAAEEAEMASVLAAMSEEERSRTAARAAELKAYQESVDSPGDIAKLPSLSPADIPPGGPHVEWSVSREGGVEVLRPKAAASGIVYTDLFFSLAGLSDAELLDLTMLADALGEMPTANYGVTELRNELDGRLGRFSVRVETYLSGPRLAVHVSSLESRLDDAVRLAAEVLLKTRFDDLKELSDLRRQARQRMEDSVRGSGFGFAAACAAKGLSERGRINEILCGMSQLRRLQQAAAPDFAALSKKVFARSRLAVSVAGRVPDGYVAALAAAFPEGEPPAATAPAALPGATSAGYEIPADTSFTAMAARLPGCERLTGAQLVAARILSLDYLWSEIRVKGGAYGGVFALGADGREAFCMSWRDPSPARTFEVFSGLGRALADFVASGRAIDRYQVAGVGRLEPYRSPRAEAQEAARLHFNGLTPQSQRILRREVLETTPAQLAAFAETLKGIGVGAGRCAVGGGGLLAPCAFRTTEQVSPPEATGPLAVSEPM